jgi:hypothetical protein
MSGRLRQPNGTTLTLSSNEVLSITNDPSTMVTENTVGFFADPGDVTVTVSTD